MAKDTKLGKTSRSSTVFNRGINLTGHVCYECQGEIQQKDLTVVKLLNHAPKTRYAHTACYERRVVRPNGPAAAAFHPEVKGKQVKGEPNIIIGRRGWSSREAGRRNGWYSI